MKKNFSFKSFSLDKKQILLDLFSSAYIFLARNLGWIFTIILLGVLVFSLHLFYQNIYNNNWSEEAKEEYLQSIRKNLSFNETLFQSVVKTVQKKENAFQSEAEIKRDIFEAGE